METFADGFRAFRRVEEPLSKDGFSQNLELGPIYIFLVDFVSFFI